MKEQWRVDLERVGGGFLLVGSVVGFMWAFAALVERCF